LAVNLICPFPRESESGTSTTRRPTSLRLTKPMSCGDSSEPPSVASIRARPVVKKAEVNEEMRRRFTSPFICKLDGAPPPRAIVPPMVTLVPSPAKVTLLRVIPWPVAVTTMSPWFAIV
jgi:hypothetical protein